MFLGKCLREDQRGNRWTQGEEGEGGEPAGNRWTQGGEREGRREEQRGNRWTQGGEREGGKEGGRTSGKPLDAGRGKGRREEGGELTLINTIIKKT